MELGLLQLCAPAIAAFTTFRGLNPPFLAAALRIFPRGHHPSLNPSIISNLDAASCNQDSDIILESSTFKHKNDWFLIDQTVHLLST
jgi:hypothetical protein